jgi:hypothetical protein
MAMSLGILFPFPTMAKPSLWVLGAGGADANGSF